MYKPDITPSTRSQKQCKQVNYLASEAPGSSEVRRKEVRYQEMTDRDTLPKDRSQKDLQSRELSNRELLRQIKSDQKLRREPAQDAESSFGMPSANVQTRHQPQQQTRGQEIVYLREQILANESDIKQLNMMYKQLGDQLNVKNPALSRARGAIFSSCSGAPPALSMRP